MGWLQKAWLDALVAGTAAGVVWVELIVWALTARPPDPVLSAIAGSLLAGGGGAGRVAHRVNWTVVIVAAVTLLALLAAVAAAAGGS